MKRRTIMVGTIITMLCLITLISVIITKGSEKQESGNLEIEYMANERENIIDSISDNDRYDLDNLLSFFRFHSVYIDGYDRETFDVEKIAAISMQRAGELKYEEIEGKYYFTADKAKVDEVAKNIFNVDIDTDKLRDDLYEAIYVDSKPIAFKDSKYVIAAANGRMPGYVNLTDSITKGKDGIYKIEFTIYDTMDSEYIGRHGELIKKRDLTNCIISGNGVAEIKEEKIGGETIYYVTKYNENITNKR